MFKINQTYGYESGFYLGSPEDNRLYSLDVDLFENYYLGWERTWPHANTSAWMWKVGWGGIEYDVIWGKVSPKSYSLQWITNVNTENPYRKTNSSSTEIECTRLLSALTEALFW